MLMGGVEDESVRDVGEFVDVVWEVDVLDPKGADDEREAEVEATAKDVTVSVFNSSRWIGIVYASCAFARLSHPDFM